jgi:hypothetical protein
MDPSCTWPGSQPDDLRRTSGRHRCSRACEVHARYIAGGDVSHCDSSNQVTPNSSSKTAASPHGCPGLTNPADERSASRTRSARPQSVTVSRTVTPVISAPPSRPPALRENTGAAGRTQGEHARLGGASSRNTRPARPVAARGSRRCTPTVLAAGRRPLCRVASRRWQTPGQLRTPGSVAST